MSIDGEPNEFHKDLGVLNRGDTKVDWARPNPGIFDLLGERYGFDSDASSNTLLHLFGMPIFMEIAPRYLGNHGSASAEGIRKGIASKGFTIRV